MMISGSRRYHFYSGHEANEALGGRGAAILDTGPILDTGLILDTGTIPTPKSALVLYCKVCNLHMYDSTQLRLLG